MARQGILNDNNIQNTRGWTYSKNNHSFYIFTVGNETYCYDTMTGEWHIRSSRNYYNSKNKPYMPLYATWFTNKIITGCCENGNIYVLDENYYRKISIQNILSRYIVRQTPVITADYKPFVLYELALEVNLAQSRITVSCLRRYYRFLMTVAIHSVTLSMHPR